MVFILLKILSALIDLLEPIIGGIEAAGSGRLEAPSWIDIDDPNRP
jgi:hypothetical protein